MTQIGKIALKTARDIAFADNTTGLITPAIIRTYLDSDIDSNVNWTDNVDTDTTLAANSDSLLATQAAVKAYVDARIGAVIYSFTKSMTNGEILTSNASPVTLVAAQGAGTAIIPIGAWTMKLTYGSAAFATNTVYRFQYAGAASGIATTTGNYNYGATSYDILQMASLTGYTPATLENKAIQFFTQTGNPTAGTGSTMKVSGLYMVVTL